MVELLIPVFSGKLKFVLFVLFKLLDYSLQLVKYSLIYSINFNKYFQKRYPLLLLWKVKVFNLKF